jgi:hypothetical protein
VHLIITPKPPAVTVGSPVLNFIFQLKLIVGILKIIHQFILTCQAIQLKKAN